VFAASTLAPVPPTNDPRYSDQWDLSSNGNLGGFEASDLLGVNARYAWARTVGGADAPTIAVLDTGSTSHPDLDGRWVPGYDMVANAAKARDGNPRDDNATDQGDWNDDPGLCGVRDSSWHGTHVAGTIGATRNNSVGIAGLVGGAKIQPVRVLAQCGGDGTDVADGITWASGGLVPGLPANPTPAGVIILSLGGQGRCVGYVQSAIDGAVARGSVVVVAAGNSNTNASGFFPANCANVVTVAALDPYGWRAGYSN